MEPLRSIKQAAELLNIPESTLRKWVTARAVPFTRQGKHVRFTDRHLAEIIAAGEVRPATVPTRLAITAIRSAAPRRRRAA